MVFLDVLGCVGREFEGVELDLDAVVPVIAADRTGRLAAQAQAEPDPWSRFRFYVTRLLELQAASPPVDDIMARRYPGSQELTNHCDDALAHAARFIEAAQADGSLRGDFRIADLTAMFLANSGILRAATTVEEDAWRRHLEFVLDGLRVRIDEDVHRAAV